MSAEQITEKQVYLFEEGNASMVKLLGGKGGNLAEMTALGLPIPPGFTITTDACKSYYKQGGNCPVNCSPRSEGQFPPWKK